MTIRKVITNRSTPTASRRVNSSLEVRSIMKISIILGIIGAWLATNMLLPIFLRSLERVYQTQIDSVIKSGCRLTKVVMLSLLQGILIIYFAPSILIIGVVERVYPRFFELPVIKRSSVYSSLHLLFTRRFWMVLAEDFRNTVKIRKLNTAQASSLNDTQEAFVADVAKQSKSKMNVRLKNALKYFSVFFAGLIIGAFLIETIEMHLRPSYRDLIIRTHLKTEQEFLASRAARENKHLEAAFHRWAVVNAESDEGFRVFQEHGVELDDQPYTYPFDMYMLKWMSSGANIKKGRKIVEGFDRGKLAVALEALGQKKEAENQWQSAQILIHRKTIKETKEAVYVMLEQEKSDIHLKAEDKILGKKKE